MQRRVLVTGASKGIGKSVAINLAKSGFNITVHYNSDKIGAEETLFAVREIGVIGDMLQFDISNREQCKHALDSYIQEHGSFYGVINNAGICHDTVFPAMEPDIWDSVVHTNIDGFYNVIQPCVLPMIQSRKGGRIITLASVSGLVGNRGQVNYSAAKAGIIGASKALALELAKRKITVNCVAPGLIDTDMTIDAPINEILKVIPARRIGKPDEVASLINYLMSDGASYITRQVISVNGGLV